eukprot:gene31843-39333_t
MIANAWNIADNDADLCMGFAGTDDTSHLLPMQVHKHDSEELVLRATNGTMLKRLLGADSGFCHLAQNEDGASASCRATLLNLAVSSGHRALIDAGALCTGSSNEQVADYLLTRLDRNSFRGVVYFDDSQQKWTVKDFQGQLCDLNMPIHERDCFVYFDESRCRGSDMKLLPHASALLTLGLKICKDKVMQAAGRMRQFGSGQTVMLVAADDVAQQILTLNGLGDSASASITTEHAIHWVLHNTIEATKAGMVERAHQGLYFCTTNNNCSLVTLEEKSLLQDYYSEKQSLKTMQEVHKSIRQYFMGRAPNLASTLSTKMRKLLTQVDVFADQFGVDVQITGSKNEEEAEKQLEKEVEKEVEREVQLPVQIPADEMDWVFENVFFERLPAGVLPLQQMVEKPTSASLSLKSIQWNSETQIQCTSNFINTLKPIFSFNAQVENDYLRTVDVCLYFTATKRVLLVSEREADAILTLMLKHKTQQGVQFIHLSDLHREYNALTVSTAANKTPIPPLTAFLLMLFNGDTTFPPGSKSASAMTATVKGKRAAQSAALKIPPSRGKSHLLPMSDLEATCKELA